MTSTLHLRPTFAGRISRFVPAIAGLALALGGLTAYGDNTSLALLNEQLKNFATEKTTPPAVPKVPTLLTAKPDDVVYAVYRLTLDPGYGVNTPDKVADLVRTALEAQTAGTSTTLKVRADKDKIAARILNAALIGSGLSNDSTAVTKIIDALATVNANINKALSVGGKEAVIGQALKSTAGSDDAVGQAIADKANTLSSAVPGTNVPAETKLKTFSIAAIKAAGTATGEVRSFTNELLTFVTSTAPGFTKGDFTKQVAEGVVKVPDAAGQVFGAFADTLNDETQVRTATGIALLDTKLKAAISAIVAGTASATAVSDEAVFAKNLVTDLLVIGATKATTAVRASIASGAIRAINQTLSTPTVSDVIDNVLAPGAKVLTKAELSTFAGGAAVGTGDSAGDVVTKVVAFADTIAPADLTVRKNIGIATLKAIAATSPDSGSVIAQALVAAGGTLFTTDLQKIDLAKALAKGVATSGPTAGSAVAGVGSTLNSGAPTSDGLASFTATVIPSATKAAVNIAKEVSALSAVTNYADFATKVVLTTGFSVNNAPSVAAGVAVTAVAGTTVNLTPGQATTGQVTSGQNAGQIAVAVANASIALKKKTAVIAGAVALTVDVERIADIGAKVGALYQKAIPVDPNLPKFSAIGTLATSLAKAINTKPLVSTANRVDELGELASELTRAAIAGLGATDPKLASTIGSIGTAVMKGLSSALLINAGAFAADLKDAAGDIAGSIAQTISVAVLEGKLTATQAGTLLGDGVTVGTVETALKKAAKKFAADVTTAFAQVRGATGATNRLFVSTDSTKPNEFVSNANTGGSVTGMARFEIGSVIEQETPITNLP